VVFALTVLILANLASGDTARPLRAKMALENAAKYLWLRQQMLGRTHAT
jgi:hypothetical protein